MRDDTDFGALIIMIIVSCVIWGVSTFWIIGYIIWCIRRWGVGI